MYAAVASGVFPLFNTIKLAPKLCEVGAPRANSWVGRCASGAAIFHTQ